MSTEVLRLRQEVAELREEMPHGGIHSVRPYQNLLIYLATTLAVRAKVVVELGTGAGNSAEAFLAGLAVTDGQLYSIDAHPEDSLVMSTVERLSTNPRFTFIPGDSVKVGKRWRGEEIDVLYVNSAHSYDHVLNELKVWGKLRPKVILVHDILKNVGREKGPPFFACEEYVRVTKMRFYPIIGFACGVGVILP